MTRKLFLLLASLAFFSLACAAFTPHRATIQNVTLSADILGAHPTTTFSPSDTFYCNVSLDNAPEGTRLAVVWTAVQVDGAGSNTTIRRTETRTGSGVTHFKLGNRIYWPTGKYRLDLYLNDQLAREVDFTVN